MNEAYIYSIVLIVLLSILIIFVLMRKSKKKDSAKIKSVDVKPTQMKTKLQKVDSNINFVLNGEEEGSFGSIDNTKTKIDTDEPKKENPKKYRQKCEVPEHGKISKDNFKEFAGVKILIAEDNLINQKVLNGLLCDSGIEITMADDGQIALDILEKNSDFNIILMDAHMPRVDGFEATRIIRANPNYEHIVVIALSGDTAADDVRKMMESGMQEHLEKPLKVEALYEILYAYTKTDTKTKNSEFIEVIMTKELNGNKGLAVCSGDEEFYIDILDEFVKDYTDSPAKLNKLLENGNIKDADALLLDIIGVCANIGANNIKNIAQDLKESIKNTQERSFILLLDRYKQHLKILLQDIEDYKNL